MASTDLNFGEPGSLPKPGPIGRLVRLAFGALCLLYVLELIRASGFLLTGDGHIRSMIWNGIVLGLLLVSYVINIGYSRPWKKWPAIASAIALLIMAGAGYVGSGTIENQWLASAIWLWLLYVFSHLGMAFVLAGAIGTPGCEMRAFHDVYSRLTGTVTKEHYCPVGPLHLIDQWEARRTNR